MLDSVTTPGTILLGKYRVDSVIGRGAMGIVIAATNIGLNQKVAIKFMLPGKGTNPERHERFMREARIAARLTNQHIARVLDVGTLEESAAPYLVMEFLRGKDLEGVLEERGVLPFAEAVSYVLQVCEAVAEAHKAGIVHRDLKPANLFLTKLADGSACVKVLDFGVSKLTETGGAELTHESAVMGSPLYMPPEQMQASRDVDARADVWSLGIVLYQLVAGITPFHAEGLPQVCTRVFMGEPTPLTKFRPDAPAGLEAVLLRCFEKDRDQRWQNLAELAAALVPFGPARAVVHAERAAAILGLDAGPSRLTDVLPPEPATTASARALSALDGLRGTLDTVAKIDEAPQPSGMSLPIVLGAAIALVLGAAGVVFLWASPPALHEPSAAGLSTLPSVVPPPASQSSSAPPPSASAPSPPVVSAAPSARVVVAVPKHSAVPVAPPPRPTASVKTIPVPGKGTILDRD